MPKPAPDYRIGIGIDSHPLTPGRPLMLGGAAIPHDRGLAGHSDGDVLIHALMDALLGAANLGDKGTHFPPRNPATPLTPPPEKGYPYGATARNRL